MDREISLGSAQAEPTMADLEVRNEKFLTIEEEFDGRFVGRREEGIMMRAMVMSNQVSMALRSTKISKDASEVISQSFQKLIMYLSIQNSKIVELETRIDSDKIHDISREMHERGEEKGVDRPITYADKVKQGRVDRLERARSRSKSRANRVVLVYPKKEQTSVETKKKVQENLKFEKLSGRITGFRHVAKGGISIEFEDSTDVNKVIEQVNDNERLKGEVSARLPIKRDPQIIVFGVEEEIQEKELLNLLVEHNVEFGGLEDVKVRTKFKGRRGLNWILSIKPISFMRIKDKGRISTGLQSYPIRENLKPLLCYRCGNFGHTSKVCNRVARCIKCGSDKHEKRECVTQEVTCIHCLEHNNRFKSNYNSKHRCMSKECRVYQKEVDRVILNTLYVE